MLKSSFLTGYVGGSLYSDTGAAVDPLCLPRNPEWEHYRDGTDGYKAYIYGAEYETIGLRDKWLKLHDHDVPCAVCLVRNRSVVKMFPGKSVCQMKRFLTPWIFLLDIKVIIRTTAIQSPRRHRIL